MERLLCLDIGTVRIGVAISDGLGIIAQPVETFRAKGWGPDVKRVQTLCQELHAAKVLVGLPRNMDGSEGFQAASVREFACQLEKAGLCVLYWDERLTTRAAGRMLAESGRTKDRKAIIDTVAAVLILQSYLDAHSTHSNRSEA